MLYEQRHVSRESLVFFRENWEKFRFAAWFRELIYELTTCTPSSNTLDYLSSLLINSPTPTTWLWVKMITPACGSIERKLDFQARCLNTETAKFPFISIQQLLIPLTHACLLAHLAWIIGFDFTRSCLDGIFFQPQSTIIFTHLTASMLSLHHRIVTR